MGKKSKIKRMSIEELENMSFQKGSISENSSFIEDDKGYSEDGDNFMDEVDMDIMDGEELDDDIDIIDEEENGEEEIYDDSDVMFDDDIEEVEEEIGNPHINSGETETFDLDDESEENDDEMEEDSEEIDTFNEDEIDEREISDVDYDDVDVDDDDYPGDFDYSEFEDDLPEGVSVEDLDESEEDQEIDVDQEPEEDQESEEDVKETDDDIDTVEISDDYDPDDEVINAIVERIENGELQLPDDNVEVVQRVTQDDIESEEEEIINDAPTDSDEDEEITTEEENIEEDENIEDDECVQHENVNANNHLILSESDIVNYGTIGGIVDFVLSKAEEKGTKNVVLNNIRYEINESLGIIREVRLETFDRLSERIQYITIQHRDGDIVLKREDEKATKHIDDIIKLLVDSIIYMRYLSSQNLKVDEEDTKMPGNYDKCFETLQKMISEGHKKDVKEMLDHDDETRKIVEDREAVRNNEINPKMILDILNDSNDSIFDEREALDKEFKEGPFYPILKQVMARERFVNMPETPVRFVVRINQMTNFFTVVDFNTGYRFIYIDTDDQDQLGCNPVILSKNIPFAFPKEVGGNHNFRLRIVYKDSCEERPIAVIRRMQKIVANDYIDDKYRVRLFGNYVVGYTTDVTTVSRFEYGDVTSTTKGNSPHVVGRPHTRRVGILILDKKKGRENKRSGMNDINTYDFVKNYDIFTVASCRYIENDRAIRDSSIPEQEKFVRYTITQYDEINSVIIEDGLYACLNAIRMEHSKRYGNQVRYSVEFELDRSSLNPVSIDRLVDEGELLLMSKEIPYNEFGVRPSKILCRSNRLPDIIYDKGRVDSRFFVPRTISAVFPQSIVNNYNLSKGREGVEEFLKGRGYMECCEPIPVTFDVDPYKCIHELNHPDVAEMIEIDVNALSSMNNTEFDRLRMVQARFEASHNSSFTDSDSPISGDLLFRLFDTLNDISGFER